MTRRYIPTSALTIGRAVKLQRKLNTIFVMKRDAGENIEQLYRHLKRVEGWLSARGIYWGTK